MNWIAVSNDAWEVSVEVKNLELLDDLKMAASGLLAPIGVPKLDTDPETELKRIIERELLDVLCKRFYGKDLLSLFEEIMRA